MRVLYQDIDQPQLRPAEERPALPVFLAGYEWAQYGEVIVVTIKYQPVET